MGKKKIKRIVITSLIITAIGATSVLAYFMSRDARVDKYKIKSSADKNGVKIFEKYDQETSQDIMPADIIEKDLQIKNTASYAQFIRVKITPSFTEAPNIQKEVDNNLVQLIFNNSDSELENASEGSWTKGNDGYYYYLGKVESGFFTSELLHGFMLHIDANNEYQGAGFDLQIEAEAIQAQNDVIYKSWEGVDSSILNKINSFKNSQPINHKQISGTLAK